MEKTDNEKVIELLDYLKGKPSGELARKLKQLRKACWIDPKLYPDIKK